MLYAKAAISVVVAVASAAVAALMTGHPLGALEWVNVAIAGFGAASVFTAPNVPGAPVTKTAIATLTAALTLIATLLGAGHGITPADWLQIAVAALGAAGVYSVPNRTSPSESTI